MKYIKVKWIHSLPCEPIWLYSELNENRWETRKVEIFGDGSYGYASASASIGKTRLGKMPIPPLDKISEDAQFQPVEITKEEFDEVWMKRES
jgi:hypothetical protein